MRLVNISNFFSFLIVYKKSGLPFPEGRFFIKYCLFDQLKKRFSRPAKAAPWRASSLHISWTVS